MADLNRSSTIEEEKDPLHAYSGLSLFPSTLKSLSIPLPPPLIYQSKDLQQTHTLLQSMPFEIRKEHLEQAKAILESSVASEDANGDVDMNPIPNKRERRPGLDRKQRGKFTFKPLTSQAPENKPPTFDPSKYPKPEDFFAAYEKYENAVREWEKQTGTVVADAHQNQPSRRSRGPGIPGRKRGSYKHTYTDSYLADLKAFENETSTPAEENIEKTTAARVPTEDREVDDSTVDSDKDLENVLAKLLACSPNELEGDAGVKLLEKHLNIKPIDKKVFSLPEFPDVKRMHLKASGRSPSTGRTALSNIQNLLKGNNSSATRKIRPSPNPQVDQFSFPDRHNLLPGDLQSTEVDLEKDLDVQFRSSVANDTDKVITNVSPSSVGTVHVASPFNGSVQKISFEVDSDTQSGIRRSHSRLDGNADNRVDDSITKTNSATIELNVDMQTKISEVDVSMCERGANRDTDRRENDADTNEETANPLDSLADCASKEAARMDSRTLEKDGIPCQQDETTISPIRAPEQHNTMDGSFEHAENIQEKHSVENDNADTVSGPQPDVHKSSEKLTSKRRKKESCDSSKKKRSKTAHDESEADKQIPTVSNESGAKKQTKRKSKEQEEKKQKKTVTRESKIFSRRKSLAAAGTKFESGVRRSTRIKSRPLEYWRGERFLYGRVHESLTTVIGIKYASPDKERNEWKNERPVLKVKSFVSDEYKELIKSAALH